MRRCKLLAVTMMVLTLFGAASCITDPEFKPADITVSATTLEFSAEGGSATLELLSNRDWTLEVVGEEVTWLAVSMISAEASETSREIRISTLPLDGVTRQAILKFKTETVYASVRVTQKGNVSSAVTSFSDDFSSIEEANVAYAGEGWSFYSSDPSDVYYGWRTGVYNSDKYIQIAPYSSAQSEVVAYATTPLLNVRDAAQKTLSFQLALYYKEEDASKLEVVASTDFAGDYAAATWTVVYDATFPAGSSMNTWKTHTVNLEEAFGDVAEVHFAFRYTGKSNTYRLDNVVFGDAAGTNPDNPDNPDNPNNPSDIGDNWKNPALAAFGDDFQSIQTGYISYVSDNWTFWSSDLSDINYQFKTRVWESENGAEKYLDIAPYASSQAQVTAFALLPKIDVAAADPKELKFDTALYYKEEDQSRFEVVVSTDFDGDFSAATWTVVYDATYPAASETNVWKTHAVNFADYAGESELFVAFRYTGKSNTYRLDNVIFGTPEHMNGGNEGNGDDPGNTNPGGGEGDGIYTSNLALPTGDSSADAHYLVKVIVDGAEYPALKLGKSEAGGTYTVGNLPATGDVTLTFYGVAWKGKSCDLTIVVNNGGQIDGASSKTLSLVPNQGATQNTPFTITFGDKDFYTLSLTGVTESTTLTFSTPDAKPRCILTGLNMK